MRATFNGHLSEGDENQTLQEDDTHRALPKKKVKTEKCERPRNSVHKDPPMTMVTRQTRQSLLFVQTGPPTFDSTFVLKNMAHSVQVLTADVLLLHISSPVKVKTPLLDPESPRCCAPPHLPPTYHRHMRITGPTFTNHSLFPLRRHIAAGFFSSSNDFTNARRLSKPRFHKQTRQSQAGISTLEHVNHKKGRLQKLPSAPTPTTPAQTNPPHPPPRCPCGTPA